MNIDDYKHTLNEKLNIQAADTFSGRQLILMIASKRNSIFRKLKIVLRIEILICLYEVISECIHFFNTPDNWSKTYALINMLISILFIGIFVNLIRKINDPSGRALPVKENTQLVLSVMKRFYNSYLRFILFYAIMNAVYNIAGVLIKGTAFEDGKAVTQVMSKIKEPLWQYSFLFGLEIVEGLLLYFLCRLVIWLFYHKRIKQLQQLADEMNY
jgi:hypothetical protein